MKPYAFEDIGDELELMPIAARRAADAAGLRPSLGAWRALSHAARAELVRLGSEAPLQLQRITTILSAATPPAEVIEPIADPQPTSVPETLARTLPAELPLSAAVWSALSALDRYALVKVARKGEGPRVRAAYAEIVGASAQAPHLDASGAARMVSVSVKEPTLRRAVATSCVQMNAEAFERLLRADAPKGDVLGTARIAGIQGAKRTSELVPLCHPLSLTRIDVKLVPDASARSVRIEVTVEAVERTGVEMEALSAASVAALTVYDMLKAFDRGMSIGPTRLQAKSGGRSDFQRLAAAESARFALSTEPLVVEEVLALVARPEAGASVAFLGTVRDHNAGLDVTALEYEAYAAMAVKEMAELAAELERELPGVALSIRHRTGALRVGEVAVICAASAAHRDEAFRAARALIDRVKQRVPIWKREHGASGPYWVGFEDARVAP